MSQDVKEPVKNIQDFKLLSDDELKALEEALSAESTRRSVMRKGLDSGEQLQFETIIDLIRERTGLGDADALAMLHAHVPVTPPLRGRPAKRIMI